MAKTPLLFLCHRMPFPPNKGDKITTFNLLKFLGKHYDIHLGCFIDDDYDRQYLDELTAMAASVNVVTLNTATAKAYGLRAFLSGEPITLPYYYRNSMQKWVDDVIDRHSIKHLFVYCSSMAQYVSHYSPDDYHKVVHMADIDSDKWQQYADTASGVMRWVYRREAARLADYERQLVDEFNVCCFISDAETALFRQRVEPGLKDKVQTLGNGIDLVFFDPAAEMVLAENHLLDGADYIVFTGAMDYWANADAVIWFVSHCWPLIIDKRPEARFYIVGSKPGKSVQDLETQRGVVVTGRVEDVRPYLSGAAAAVAPMCIARGIQNKILEAMAMQLPVSTTPMGIEGLEGCPNEMLQVTDDPALMATWLIEQLDQKPVATTSRRWLADTYSWNAKLSPVLAFLQNGGPGFDGQVAMPATPVKTYGEAVNG
ncbi:TIGR03087 family PEP-CTERM/XrtA system glycosyltransferase [Parasalinivibrio latis]|uniref:TIGR03087 family PEP-CTERM/XrtA system glycosyltransferase n=1 Tax=Parasalinivibrio latis TaxID=2952610 RepID=UPI0030E09879